MRTSSAFSKQRKERKVDGDAIPVLFHFRFFFLPFIFYFLSRWCPPHSLPYRHFFRFSVLCGAIYYATFFCWVWGGGGRRVGWIDGRFFLFTYVKGDRKKKKIRRLEALWRSIGLLSGPGSSTISGVYGSLRPNSLEGGKKAEGLESANRTEITPEDSLIKVCQPRFVCVCVFNLVSICKKWRRSSWYRICRQFNEES